MAKRAKPKPEAVVQFLEGVLAAHVKHVHAIAQVEEQTGISASILLNLAESLEFNRAVDELPPAEAGRILKLLVLLNRSGGNPEEFLAKSARERRELAKEIELVLQRKQKVK